RHDPCRDVAVLRRRRLPRRCRRRPRHPAKPRRWRRPAARSGEQRLRPGTSARAERRRCPVTADLALVFVAGALIACGVTLLLQRSLSRIVIGVLLAGNGVNVLFLAAGGPAGRAPIIGAPDERGNLAPMSDPLPQA